MLLKSALVMFALALAELVLFFVASGRFNPVLVTLLVLALSLTGMWLLVKRGPGVLRRSFEDLVEQGRHRLADDFGVNIAQSPTNGADRAARPPDQVVADGAVKLVGAMLLAFPGLLTGLVGALLFVGPVRDVAVSLLGSRLVSLLPAGALDGRSGRRSTEVVDVTSSMKDPARSASSSAHPELR